VTRKKNKIACCEKFEKAEMKNAQFNYFLRDHHHQSGKYEDSGNAATPPHSHRDFHNMKNGQLTHKLRAVRTFVTFNPMEKFGSFCRKKALVFSFILCPLLSIMPAMALTVDDLNLIEVARHGDNRLFKILLARGANPNARDQGNNTAILMAAYFSKRDVVRQLIELNVDVNVLGSLGFTPVGAAAMRADNEIVKMLIKAGANLDVLDHEGETPLLRAIRAQRDENLKTLVLAGANVDKPNKSGETPLMVAAQLGRADYVEALLAKNANPNPRDKEGGTALYFAVFNGYDEIAKRLIQAGSTVQGVSNGYTLLHWADAMGRKDIVPLLVNAGAVN
jgi:ankyrin repeat protein